MHTERFIPGSISERSIERSAIIKQIENMPRGCIMFIHSPAGYGKTTAVAQWLEYTNRSAAWVALDEYSVMPCDVYGVILRSMSCEAGKDFILSPLKNMLRALEANTLWPDALVIDDFHLCATESGISEALPLIRLRLPSNTSLVVISRNPPPPALNEQIHKRIVRQLNDLQFSSSEVVRLFQANSLPISGYNAVLLQRQTGGWAAALSAAIMAHENGESFVGILNRDALNDYLRGHVFNDPQAYAVLKKCSVCDKLNEELCGVIMKREDSWPIIQNFTKRTGLIIRTGENTYRFHDLLRDFLRDELQSDKSIDKPELYKSAACWYMETGDILRALDMASKSGDIKFFEECSRKKCEEYETSSADIEGIVLANREHLLLRYPSRLLEQSLRLSIDCFLATFYYGQHEEGFFWLNVIKKHLKSGRAYMRSDIVLAAMVTAIDPREGVWGMPERFAENISLLEMGVHDDRAVADSMTTNFAFWHRAQLDYTDIAPRLDEYLESIDKHMSHVFGQAFKTLLSIVRAGILYERGEFAQAERIACEAAQMSGQLSPEIKFCAYAIYFEILRVQGKKIEPERIGEMITSTGAHYLAANFNAYMTNIQLYSGGKDAADIWLMNADPSEPLKLYKIEQHFTTAHALIVTKQFTEAEELLVGLAKFSQDYRRSGDYIQAQTLRAICKWNMKKLGEAVEAATSAIRKAGESRIVMPIAKEGNDILPVLQKVLNRLKHGYDVNILDKAFVNHLFVAATQVSRNIRGMLPKYRQKPIDLSPRQQEILELLAENMSYQEIGDKLGIKITTVREHITRIYEKLEVSNAIDAVLKAKGLK